MNGIGAVIVQLEQWRESIEQALEGAPEDQRLIEQQCSGAASWRTETRPVGGEAA